MKLPPKVRAMVVGAATTGAITVGVAGVLARRTGLGLVYELVTLTIFLALSWAYPVLVLRTEETEAFQLDEAFFVAMALLLPAAGTIVAFAAALVLGNCIRRRPLVRAAFNTGQTVTAVGIGLATMHLLAPIRPASPTAAALGAAVVGAAVFLLVNSAAVSVVISLNDEKRAIEVFLDGLDLRALVFAGGVSLGLLAAIGASAHPWALALGALPMAAVNLVLREHSRARSQRQRAEGLFVAASQIHAAVARDAVEVAVVDAARSLLRCRAVRVDASPPGPDEIGASIPVPKADRWLVAADPMGFEPFGAADRELINALAGIAAAALENARLLKEIRHRAIHDGLTELPNKVLFMDRLVHALAKTRQPGQRLAVIFLDVDRFKVINDSLGHAAGDLVLLGVAARLRSSLRPGDTVARLGGDEFALLCEDLDSRDTAASVAERFRAAASGSWVSNGVELGITASVGIVMVESGADVSAPELLQAADTAMYRAKERGRDRVEVFDRTLRNQAYARLKTETTLRRALDDGRLRVFYQPILDAASGRVTEAEALLRIETPAGALLSPADFIEVAEGSGLIATIGVGVLEEACRQAVEWRHRFGDDAPSRIAVNLSAGQLSRMPVAETVKRVLADTRCSPSMLALEITETVLLEAGEQVREELAVLRKMGVTIGLDDFGTGYSSLAYIKRFPLDFLKIDRCFVSGLGRDQEDEAIVDAIISLGRSLGLSTVAEGVETGTQKDRLRSLGCDRLQGYLFARPQPPSQMEGMLAEVRLWDQPQLVLPPL